MKDLTLLQAWVYLSALCGLSRKFSECQVCVDEECILCVAKKLKHETADVRDCMNFVE